MPAYLSHLCFFLLLFGLVNSQNWILNTFLSSDYENDQSHIDLKTSFSYEHNNMMVMNASIKLHKFSLIEIQNAISTDLTLCLNWTDPRFYSNASGPFKLTQFAPIPIPPIFFSNAQQAQTINTLLPFQYFQIWPMIQQLQLCTRLDVTFLCRLELGQFPFDEQYCNFELQSFDKNIRIQLQSISSVTANAKFRVKNTYTGACNSEQSGQFNFQTVSDPNGHPSNDTSCTRAGIHLVRNFAYYFIRYYAPSVLLVLTSFASFWFPTMAPTYPARATLTGTVQLTLITISLQAYAEVPTSLLVPLFWWFWMSQFFIYITEAEFGASMAWIYHVREKRQMFEISLYQPPTDSSRENLDYSLGANTRFGLVDKAIALIFGHVDPYADPVKRNRIDYLARLLVPSLYLIFIVVYFCATVPAWNSRWSW